MAAAAAAVWRKTLFEVWSGGRAVFAPFHSGLLGALLSLHRLFLAVWHGGIAGQAGRALYGGEARSMVYQPVLKKSSNVPNVHKRPKVIGM